MSELLERMKKINTNKTASVLSESSFFMKKDTISTKLPVLNIAFSGQLDGGFTSGVTFISGLSKMWKSLISLYCMKAYFDKYPDAIALLWDSEFGITPEYMRSHGIDTSRIIHIPVEHIEQLKFDMVKRLNELQRDDHVFMMVDSLGSLASKKEVEDAIEEKSVADMTRAKAIRSLLRIITPHVTMKDIPCMIINHVYSTNELYSKTIVSGGCLVAGTKIIMADSSLKSVEDIIIGDEVKTLIGNKPVTYTWEPENLIESYPVCYKITFEDGSTVTCSNQHKFLIDDDWITAENLISGMNVTTYTQ